MKSSLLTTLVCFGLSLTLSAQSSEIGFGPGVGFYGGDLSGREFFDYFNNLNPAANLFYRTELAGPLDFRLSFSYTRLSGDDAQAERLRNLNFRNNLLELSTLVDWNVFAFNTRNGPLTFYLFAGGGVAYHNPKTFYQGTYIELQPLGTEGQGIQGQPQRYSKFIPVIPAGGGLKLPVGPQWAIQGEFAGRIPFTDYLDDVGANTISYDELLVGNGPLAATLNNREFELTGDEPGSSFVNPDAPRGNRINDYYYIGTISLIYRFAGAPGNNRGARCPTF